MIEINKVHLGDCIDLMEQIDDNSIDMILCDLPYGTTSCSWDTIIPFDKLWYHYERIIKDGSAIVLTAAQPFTSNLVMSNPKLFKYEWVWKKSKAQHFAQAPYRPMTIHENVLVFSNGGTAKNANNRMKYNPQGLIPFGKIVSGKKAQHSEHRMRKTDQEDYVQEWTNYPNTLLEFNNEGKTIHPTQKPVDLFEHLIKTYSNENDIVLDNCMGSFTTAIACMNTNRRFIGMEKEERYYELGQERLRNHEKSKIVTTETKTTKQTKGIF